MKKYLSVDCGGTKTAFLLCDESGRSLASCILGPANYLVNGIETVLKIINKGLRILCIQAECDREEISCGFIAIAGYGDIPDDLTSISHLIEKELYPIPVLLGNDTDNALAGSLLGKSGIHIIAGTGSIGLGYDEKQQYIRSGGWHHLFGGDEGSAYWIGCQLICHFTKQADGREEKSELYSYLMQKYGLERPENILDLVVRSWRGERDKIALLSKDVYELAEREDPNALQILYNAGKELAQIVKSIYSKGDFGETLIISYSGGVFKALKYLVDAIEDSFVDIPHILVAPQLIPVVGGVLLAYRAVGIKPDESVIRNLKELESNF